MSSGLFFVLDFDRCLLDTARVSGVFEEAIAEVCGNDIAQMITYDREAVEAGGGSYDTYTALSLVLGDDSLVAAVGDMFVEKALAYDLAMPGARDLIHLFDTSAVRYGILTYGSAHWQKLKLRAAGFDNIPHLITDQPEKAHVLRTWQGEGGVFVLPRTFGGGSVTRLALVDDKLIAFDNLPEGVEGYLVHSGIPDTLPIGVAYYDTLHDLYRYLATTIDKNTTPS